MFLFQLLIVLGTVAQMIYNLHHTLTIKLENISLWKESTGKVMFYSKNVQLW